MANDPSVYLDATATVVAKVTWWRDAGPVDLNTASVWGEGSIVYLTLAGLTQLTAEAGDITIGASAQREARKVGNDGQPTIRVASAVYPLR